MSSNGNSNTFQLADALVRQMQGISTAEDDSMITSWLESSEQNRETYLELKEEKSQQAIFERMAAIDTEASLDRLHQKIGRSRKIKLRRMVMVGLSSAAILAGVFMFIRFSTTSKTPMIAAQEKISEIDPARQRAVLVMAGGKQLTLEPAADSSFVSGGATVQLKGDVMRYLPTDQQQSSQQQLMTPRGTTFKMVLADGTKVWLNAASSIKYPSVFAGEKREVEVSGEVYFDVAKDAARPFVVRGPGRLEVKVLGTAFNVRAYGEMRGSSTTLVEGSVMVSQGTASRLLKPGQQAMTTIDAKPQGIEIHSADLSEVTAWKSQLFKFNGTPVSQVLEEMARWYDVSIEYEDGFDGKEAYHGEVSRQVSLQKLTAMLQTTGVAQFKIIGRKLYVAPIKVN